MTVGETINDKTILWMDKPSPIIPDMLIKVGELDGTETNNEICQSCNTKHTKTTKKYKNVRRNYLI